MLCSNCGFDNPSDNRFCGMCGIPLERIPVPQREAAKGDVIRQRLGNGGGNESAQPVSDEPVSKPYEKLPLKPLRGRRIDSPEEEAEIPQNGNSAEPPAEKRPQRAISGPSFLNLEVPTEPHKEQPTISGPSFLGLADEGRYNIDYLLEDEPKESHWRMWLVLIILGLFGVMAWLQLRHSGLNVAGLMQRVREAKLGTVLEQTNPRTGSADAAPVPNDNSKQSAQAANNPNSSSGGSAAGATNTGDQTTSATAAPQPGTPEVAKSSESTTPDKSNSVQKSDSSSAATPAGATAGAQSPSDQSKAADSSASHKSSPADQSSAASDQENSDVEPPASKSVTTAKNTAPKKPSATVDDSDARAARSQQAQGAALVANGEKYLYGRGVPQNCERAISYLRKASDMGSAKGSSHLGAMYATGQCLPMDRVRAYKYFAQALHQDNTNQYFQQNLEMLWNEMSPQEKQEATARTPAQ